MKTLARSSVVGVVLIVCAPAALAGDLVVDGRVSTGAGVAFADGSLQVSAAYPRWSQIAIVDVNGRGDYTDPATAMADLASWCGSPSIASPCLLKILPGHYDLGSSAMVMQPHVDIEGSGRNITVIATSSPAAAVYGANATELRSLTVVNSGGGGETFGIDLNNVVERPRISDVDVLVFGSNSHNIGIRCAYGSELDLENVRVWVSDGDVAMGIIYGNSSGALHHVEVNVEASGSSAAQGIALSDALSFAMTDSRIHVTGGAATMGIGALMSNSRFDRVMVEVEAGTIGTGFNSQLACTSELAGSSIRVRAGTTGTGVITDNFTTSTLTDVRIDVAGGSVDNVGVRGQVNSEQRLEHTNIVAMGGDYAYGVLNVDGTATTLIDVTSKASGASTYNYGVFNQDDAAITAANLIAEASGGAGSYGVMNGNGGGTVIIDRSTIGGVNASIRNDNSSVDFVVGGSKLDGPVTANLTCYGNYDATYAAVICP